MNTNYYDAMDKAQKGLYQAIISGMPAEDIELIANECYKLSRKSLNQIAINRYQDKK